jgi:hypothetical protein
MIYYVDIDNTICITENTDYENSKPITKRISLINKLYDEGHTIVYWTARGSKTGKDWSALTLSQLNSWGCKRTELKLNKPSYDLFIDDKAINTEAFFND